MMTFSKIRAFFADPKLLVVLSAVAISSCASTPPPLPTIDQLDKKSPDYVNPYPEGTHLHFQGRKDYPKTYDSYKNSELLANSANASVRIVIDISDQRGQLFVNDEVAMDYPLSTGVKKHPTPTGDFTILEKVRSGKASNLYGKMYDAEDKVVDSDAKSTDEVPEGGRFAGAPMPYWMRLTNGGIGMHVGKVRRSPVSHGCLRHQRAIARTIFDTIKLGTPVTIQD